MILFFLAKFLSPTDLGIYGLFTVTINILVLVVGIDFYVFNTRELLSTNNKNQWNLIKNQFFLHLITYVVIFPFVSILFIIGIIPLDLIIYFYILLILEHLLQESSRLLFTLSKPILSNLVLFFRSGIWVYFSITLIYLDEELKNLEFIFIMWIFGGMLGLILVIIYFRKHRNLSVKANVDFKWIIRGLRTSSSFYLSTLVLLIIQYIDRYIIKYYYGDTSVGVYTFFTNISNVIQTFIVTGVFSILYPKLISSFKKGNMNEYKKIFSRMVKYTILGLVPILFILSIGIFPLLNFIDKEVYTNYILVFFILIFAVTFNILSQIPHYGLYSRGNDKEILISTLASAIVAVILNLLLIPRYELYGAAISSAVSMLLLAIFKLIILKRVTKLEAV
ncbi:polysaccharide biosynthesis C-terminal domain-containing protein [Rossellomorea sp. KS-H15a]|uniref:oligosaccharide flippase family protein n=1 Tax=Rossellomorea sp. KS-H15a TaxID=2963940 RepID=UPI0020C6246E|nr:polysaccharide biosynthesis C-terminal domain-containing protein [Rossellomorea sp. KS-H15a]UTE77503.1 polysaccharide biosynthesis C-terminal domain-containing protein [Rossellomorea sp. KS-H15a]